MNFGHTQAFGISDMSLQTFKSGGREELFVNLISVKYVF